MKKVLFALCLLALVCVTLSLAGLSDDPDPTPPPVYVHQTASMFDIGLGLKPGGGSSDLTCWNGCKLQNPGGCVLSWVSSKIESDGSLHCFCNWVCMPALKAWQ